MANELSGNALRFTFLETVYEATGGDPLEMVHLDLVCEQLGMDRESSELAMRWLVDELLLKYATHGPTLSVTHAGVRVVEEAREHRDRAILPFPAYNEMFRQAEPDSSDVSGEQRQEPVRQRRDAGLNSSEADRSDVADEPVLDSKLDEHEPEPRTASFSADVLLQEQVTIPLRTNPDVRAPDDKLGFAPYVDAVASFLLSPETQPPLTLSIEGDWGVGKSSFMVQLRNRIQLEAGQRDGATKPLWVEFNPWLHSKDEELWASFAVTFVRETARQLRWLERWTARTRLLLNRIWRPENNAGLLRGVAMLIGFVGAVFVGLVVSGMQDLGGSMYWHRWLAQHRRLSPSGCGWEGSRRSAQLLLSLQLGRGHMSNGLSRSMFVPISQCRTTPVGSRLLFASIRISMRF